METHFLCYLILELNKSKFQKMNPIFLLSICFLKTILVTTVPYTRRGDETGSQWVRLSICLKYSHNAS